MDTSESGPPATAMRPLRLLIAAGLVAIGYLVLYYVVPPRYEVESHWGQGGVNWFGQAPPWAFLYAAAILAFLCLVRYLLTTRLRRGASAFAWYFLLVASLLPCVWLLVVCDWDNNAVGPEGNWIGWPIIVFFVPTAVLCYDLATRTRLKPLVVRRPLTSGGRCLGSDLGGAVDTLGVARSRLGWLVTRNGGGPAGSRGVRPWTSSANSYGARRRRWPCPCELRALSLASPGQARENTGSEQ
jgi:hypothetical protein